MISTAAEYVSRSRHRVGTQIWNLSRRGFILDSSRIHVNCQEPASLITTIDELERAHSTVRKSLSLSFFLLLSASLFSLYLFSLLGGFQPPPPPPSPSPPTPPPSSILSSNHENLHCLLSESGVVAQKYRELVDSRRVASRITVTYRARINPRRLCNLSPSLHTPVSFFRTSTLFSPPSLVRPVLSLLLIDRCHACISMLITSRFSDLQANKANTTRETFHEYGCGS